MTNRNVLPDPYELADVLAVHHGDVVTALEAYGLPADLDDPAIAELVAEATALAEAAASLLFGSAAELWDYAAGECAR